MLSSKMEKVFNDQIAWEFYSGYIYLSMSTYFEEKGLPGFAKWMLAQYQEEYFHAHKMMNYVVASGGRVKLQAIDAPQHDWKAPLDAFETALEHEKGVTKRIYGMIDNAMDERDHASSTFLQWFVTEQVEEESNVGDIVNKLKLVGDGGALFMLDKELGVRVFTPPTAA